MGVQGRLRSYIKTVIKRIDNDDVPGLSAQLAYFFLLSLFPLLIFLVSLLPYLPISVTDLLNTVGSYAPRESMELIEENVHNALTDHGRLLSFGIIGTLWSGSNGIKGLVAAFNKAYDVTENRSFFIARGMALILTVAMIFVFVIALLLPVFGRQIGILFTAKLGWSEEFLHIWNALRWIISSIVLFIVLTALYWIAPNKKITCLSVMPGAVVATLGWNIVSLGFSYYVDKFNNYSATYGSLGGIIVLMIWFYLSAFVIIIGGQINAIAGVRKDPNCG
ncbi:YihY/virulence factor BrkB family protein [Peribacillus sp. SCS-155]|uniref:YihY/virulence factor BrkB family protein n=1 Tax=Peribacillus sedimenti TaxID=3115297 RepID=UPI0039066A4D